MWKYTYIVLFLSLVLAHVNSELVLIVDIFTSGARAPLPSRNPEYFGLFANETNGDLTPIGERQQYLLGTKRRQLYVEELWFLSEKYNPTEIYAESTNYNRTLMSAQAYLMGIYPLGKGPEFEHEDTAEKAVPPFPIENPDLDDGVLHKEYQPIPVYVTNEHDSLLRGFDTNTWPARNMIQNYSLEKADEEFSKISWVKDMINEINSYSNNKTITKFSELWPYVDTYYSMTFNDLEKNITLSKEFEEHMKDYLKLMIFDTYFSNEFGLKISNHNIFTLLNLLISEKTNTTTNMNETSSTRVIPKDRKYYLFSSHENTLAAMLCGIGRRDVELPKYASR